MPPLFSIGITTFDRIELLKSTINSILRQTFTDFEIIISNDNPQRKLTKTKLRIKDSRVKIINQPQNLGEVNNMNFLLKSARGKYFTWLSDDDLYQPQFLEAINQAIFKFKFPSYLVSTYTSGNRLTPFKKIPQFKPESFQGRDFIYRYLNKSLKTIGCYGVFKAKYLRQIGGITQLGQGFSPYSDNLLSLQVATLKQIIVIHHPLVFYRLHPKSISLISTDINAYFTAQRDLLKPSFKILKHQQLTPDLSRNLYYLLCWLIKDFGAVIIRSRSITLGQIISYLKLINQYLSYLKNSPYYWSTIKFTLTTIARVLFKLIKA